MFLMIEFAILIQMFSSVVMMFLYFFPCLGLKLIDDRFEKVQCIVLLLC